MARKKKLKVEFWCAVCGEPVHASAEVIVADGSRLFISIQPCEYCLMGEYIEGGKIQRDKDLAKAKRKVKK